MAKIIGAEIDTSSDLVKLFYKSSLPLAESIVSTIDDMRDYWPLTVRQVYYQQVAKEIIPNNLKQYQRVSKVLVKLREHGLVSWAAIEDRSRRTVEKRGYSNVSTWLEEQLAYLNPKNYGRCYVQHQTFYAEVSTEKDALSGILEEAIWPFCTRLNVIRGQASASIVNRIAERYDQAIMRGQTPVLLHLGDLDPSGVAIPKALQENLWRRHGVDVDVRHIALTPDQVVQYQLPSSIDAVKKNDPNYRAWVDIYGKNQPAVELDALHPDTLKKTLTDGLTAIYDMTSMSQEQSEEEVDRKLIKGIRSDIITMLHRNYPSLLESWKGR